MSASSVAPVQERPSAWPMYRAMVGIGLLCGLLIVSVFEFTKPIIAQNRAEALERAIFQVLPDVSSSVAFRALPDGNFERVAEGGGDDLVYAGYDSVGTLVGFALTGAGMGYQDVIHVLYGYSPQQHAIVGMQVLESRETPGLGDRIETDAAFLDNFRALDATLNSVGDGLAHDIHAVKQGKKTDPWQIDGITGATISSEAIGKLLHNSASQWIPRLQAHLSTFENPE